MQFSIIGMYEKDPSNVVSKSYDVGTYKFLQTTPYNVTKKHVKLSEYVFICTYMLECVSVSVSMSV